MELLGHCSVDWSKDQRFGFGFILGAGCLGRHGREGEVGIIPVMNIIRGQIRMSGKPCRHHECKACQAGRQGGLRVLHLVQGGGFQEKKWERIRRGEYLKKWCLK